MNRHGGSALIKETVKKLRERVPGIVLRTTFMVGFPGETDEDFEGTLEMLRRVRFDMTYSFIYSPRKDTPAAAMECQIPDAIKGERMNRLLETQNEIALEKNKPLEGKILKVLCDGKSKNNENVYSGRTEGNKIVLFDGDESDVGKFINIKITRAETFALYGDKI
jgi:tRNA-2-methylthio-N6-dimethylallyladenosine synthase